MAHCKSIKTILYETSHRNKKSVDQIADEIGISANYLYRVGLPLDESGVKFPLDYLIHATRCLKKFLDNPSQSNYEEVLQTLQIVMIRSAEAKKYCSRRYERQMELEL